MLLGMYTLSLYQWDQNEKYAKIMNQLAHRLGYQPCPAVQQITRERLPAMIGGWRKLEDSIGGDTGKQDFRIYISCFPENPDMNLTIRIAAIYIARKIEMRSD